LFLLTPLYTRGSVDDFLFHEERHFTFSGRLHCLREIAKGLKYLHVCGLATGVLACAALGCVCKGGG
jgi:hypothetical protein